MTRGRTWREITRTIGLVVGVAAGLTAAGSAAPRGVAQAQVQLLVEPSHTRWSYEDPSGDVRAQESLLAVDAAWRKGAMTWRAGLDVVSATGESGGRSGNFDGLGDARVGVQTRWAEGALHLGVRLETSLFEEGLTPNQLRAARVLEPFQLGFALPRPGDGTRMTATGAWQLVQRAAYHGQLGASYQLRGAYDLRDDGLALDPGDRLRAGTRWVAQVARLPVGVQVFYERFSWSDMAGAQAFRLGPRGIVQLDARVPLGRRELGLALKGLFAEAGETAPGSILDPHALRGGNRLRISAESPVWSGDSARLEGRVEFRVHRGFSGMLGRSAWITPGVRWTRRGWGGAVSISAEVSYGQVREGQTLQGAALSLAWMGSLQP